MNRSSVDLELSEPRQSPIVQMQSDVIHTHVLSYFLIFQRCKNCRNLWANSRHKEKTYNDCEEQQVGEHVDWIGWKTKDLL